MALLICVTCPRYDQRRSGEFGRALKAAIAAEGRDVSVTRVQCLGGCPADGVVALDGPGMTRVRFTHLDVGDAPAILEAAVAHAGSGTGDVEDWAVPKALAGRLSAVTRKTRPTHRLSVDRAAPVRGSGDRRSPRPSDRSPP